MKAVRGGRCSLHEDIIIEILLRLPVKSLLRFKTVCQRWNTIIRTPSFIHNHYHHRDSTGHLVYWLGEVNPLFVDGIKTGFDEEVYAFSCFPNDDDDETTFDEDVSPDHSALFAPIKGMKGSCNGVFFVLRRGNTPALWNPATRMLRPVPRCPLDEYVPVLYISGFGIDPLTDELKIVFIHSVCTSPNFAIYNVSNDSWRLCREEALVVLDGDDAYVVDDLFGPAFSNGFCYWIKCKSRASDDFVVLAFDIHHESFQEIEMPEFIIESSSLDRNRLDLYFQEQGYTFPEQEIELRVPEVLKSNVERKLHQYDDSLALLIYHRLAGDGRFDMWLLMKEQQQQQQQHGWRWTKISTVSLHLGAFSEVGVWNRNHVFATTSARKLMIYEIDSCNARNLEYRRVENASDDYQLFVFPYKESLVSL